MTHRQAVDAAGGDTLKGPRSGASTPEMRGRGRVDDCTTGGEEGYFPPRLWSRGGRNLAPDGLGF